MANTLPEKVNERDKVVKRKQRKSLKLLEIYKNHIFFKKLQSWFIISSKKSQTC